MKLFARFILSGCLLLALDNFSFGQQLAVPTALNGPQGSRPAPDMRAWTDPALNHNKLLQQNQEGGYKMIGGYKVIGSPFLFGEHHKADMFATEAKAYNIYISYNTYNQEIEFYSTSNPEKPLVKEPGTVDSFSIHQDLGVGITNTLKFVYGASLGVKDKYYFQELYKGASYSLYKRYKSDLGYVSNNYAQTDLRQFDLQYDYYYREGEKAELKKLKTNASSIIKEFKDKKDISSVFNAQDFEINQETSLRKAFEYLNQ